jgi:hypothetical protein
VTTQGYQGWVRLRPDAVGMGRKLGWQLLPKP